MPASLPSLPTFYGRRFRGIRGPRTGGGTPAPTPLKADSTTVTADNTTRKVDEN